MATYNGIKKIKIGDNVFELAVDWSNVTNQPTIPTNTDEKVKLTSSSTTGDYPLVLGPTSISSGTAYSCNYNTNIKADPSTGSITATNFYGKIGITITTNSTGTSYHFPLYTGTDATIQLRSDSGSGLAFWGKPGTTSVVGIDRLTLGNTTASGANGNRQGKILLYGSTAYAHTIEGAPTASRTITLPNKTGTVALTSDLSEFITTAAQIVRWS